MEILHQGNQQLSNTIHDLQFCTNHWGCVCCFQSGCHVCSQPIKNNNASRIQSTVWSCSSEVKRIFCVGIWQWMKNESTTTHLKQKIVSWVENSCWNPSKVIKSSTVGWQGYPLILEYANFGMCKNNYFSRLQIALSEIGWNSYFYKCLYNRIIFKYKHYNAKIIMLFFVLLHIPDQ